jgi:hypothetical protein
LRSLGVKLRSERGIHTEIAKIAKEGIDHGSNGSSKTKLVFATFANSGVETPIRKGIQTEMAKISKEWTITDRGSKDEGAVQSV